MCQDLTWIIEVVSRNINTSDFTCPVPKSCHSCTVKKCDAMFCVCRLTCRFSCRFVKSYRWGCDVHRDEYLLLFLILFFLNWFYCCLQTCGRGWMLRVCFCSLSLSLSLSSSQGKSSPPPVACLWERAWDQEDIGAVQSLLGVTLLPCSRLNFVLVCHAETIVVY